MEKPLPGSFTYLALGDSYTIGKGVSVQDRYPVQLRDSIVKSGISSDTLIIIARTGWTTDELTACIDNTDIESPYDLVTLLIGVNNQYRGRTLENYREEFVELLNRAIDFAGNDKGRVVVLSIPDWGITPFAEGRDRKKIAQEIDAFNHVNRQESVNAGVAWVDVTEISRLAAERPELLAPDGLHPSGIMYRMWVGELYPIIWKILTEN
ncbi:MAG: SGNH/GDSL hydrolase family protein [Bacteroidales bacterium]